MHQHTCQPSKVNTPEVPGPHPTQTESVGGAVKGLIIPLCMGRSHMYCFMIMAGIGSQYVLGSVIRGLCVMTKESMFSNGHKDVACSGCKNYAFGLGKISIFNYQCDIYVPYIINIHNSL